MEHFATLHKLPPDISFPDRLRDRVYYLPVERRLAYRGFMTKCTYDELIALSNDLEYRSALEHLFVRSSEEPIACSLRRPGVLFVSLCILGSVILAITIAWIAVRTFSNRTKKAADVQLTKSLQAK